ncbi:MAG TPA: (R)-hydratase [Rhodospirillaceae bacterium]|nr:(R)-hydratase [Rhodospirillaceae bacterium]
MADLPQSSAQTTFAYEDLAIGMSATLAKAASEEDIAKYAEISGDNNPVHFDEAFAARTMFKTSIAYGFLSAGYISVVPGTKLPGAGAIYMEQNLKFKAPVRIGDMVTEHVEMTALNPEKKLAIFHAQCLIRDVVVIDGEVTLMVPGHS